MVDGVEETEGEPGDGSGGVTITPYEDGPLLVRGEFRLVTPDGREIDPRRRTVALCRCGASGSKPFCDGSHRVAGFRAAVVDDAGRLVPGAVEPVDGA